MMISATINPKRMPPSPIIMIAPKREAASKKLPDAPWVGGNSVSVIAGAAGVATAGVAAPASGVEVGFGLSADDSTSWTGVKTPGTGWVGCAGVAASDSALVTKALTGVGDSIVGKAKPVAVGFARLPAVEAGWL
jgi:hypothetical protein